MFENKIEKIIKLRTPAYYYDLDILNSTIKDLLENSKLLNSIVCYSFKANANDKILKEIQKYNLGADCVSLNEMKKAKELNFNPIVLAGVGKTDEELEFAILNEIFSINVESIQELKIIIEFIHKLNKKANISLRINPNIDPLTHKYITTGLEENKFGINFNELPEVINTIENNKEKLNFIGLHFHIGSQILDFNVFKNYCLKINETIKYFEERNFKIKYVNVGGGLGIDYYNPDKIPDFKNYFYTFYRFLDHINRVIIFELGRSIVGQCGSYLVKVLYIKDSLNKNKKKLIVDGGMNHLIRPALYEAFHLIQNLSKYKEKPTYLYDIYGPICESTDCFGKNIPLPITERNDILAIRSAGAYGEVMMSNYNLKGYPEFYFSNEI
ncbi:MAG: diaminopimelate decarboxylase [bacterium]|jgi:diaminopimelate decarboxylase